MENYTVSVMVVGLALALALAQTSLFSTRNPGQLQLRGNLLSRTKSQCGDLAVF